MPLFAGSEMLVGGATIALAQDDVIKQRQENRKEAGATMRAIKGVIDAKGDVKTIVPQAAKLKTLEAAFIKMFPAGSDKGDTKALPTVWSDMAGFKGKAAAFSAAADKLAAATAAGDNAGATAAFGDVRKSCGDCHTGYREAQQRPGGALKDPAPGADLFLLGLEVLHHIAYARGGDLDAVPRAGLFVALVLPRQVIGHRLEAMTRDLDARGEVHHRRLEHQLIGGRRLEGLRIVVDAANGAASALAGPLLALTGADVVAIHDTPDGRNINAACGATDTASLAAAVVEHGADIGLALDGDADRLVAIDHTGGFVDGDHIIGILAILAGLYCMKHHALTIVVLALVVGAYWIIHGVGDLVVAASAGPVPGRGLKVVAGLFSMAAGFIILFWPGISLLLLLTITGAWLLFYGVVLAGLALTGHFLLERVLKPHGKQMPPARLRLDAFARESE